MRIKLTLVLLLLNAALFTSILLLERKAPVQALQKAERQLILPGGFGREITLLEVRVAEGNTVWRMEKREGRWFVVQPQLWPANEYAVRRLLSLLEMLTWERRFSLSEAQSAGLTVANYGLERPRATILLQGENSSHTLKLGQPTEVGQQVYLLRDQDEDVFVVQSGLLSALSWNDRDLLEPSVFSLSAFAIHHISLTSGAAPNQRVRLTRQNDLWVFESPMQARADNAQVETALAGLLGLQAITFAERAEITQGLADPWRLTLASDRQRETLLIGAETESGRYFAKLEGLETVFTIDAAPLAVWKTARESLRDRQLLLFSPERVTSIEIRQSNQQVVLQRLENGSWKVASALGGNLPVNYPADPEVVAKLLKSLHEAEALRFVTDSPSATDLQQAGLEEPQRVFTIRTDTEQVLSIGQLDSTTNQFFARSNNQATLYKIRPDLLIQFPVQALHYRARLLSELPASAVVRKVVVANIADSSTVWTREYTPDLVEEGPLETIRQHFTKLRVRQYVPEPLAAEIRVDNQLRPWLYEVRVSIELPSGDGTPGRQESVYRLTERLGASLQYGASVETGLVYLLEQPVIDAWQTILDQRPMPTLVKPAPEDQVPTP